MVLSIPAPAEMDYLQARRHVLVVASHQMKTSALVTVSRGIIARTLPGRSVIS